MQIYELVSQCTGCQTSEKSVPQPRSLTSRYQNPLTCWTKVGLDISGPFANAQGHQKFIVTVIDYVSNFSKASNY